MNKDRRNRISKIAEELDTLRDQLEEIGNEETDAADCMPENMHGSERWDAMHEAASELDSAASELEDLALRIVEVAEGCT